MHNEIIAINVVGYKEVFISKLNSLFKNEYNGL